MGYFIALILIVCFFAFVAFVIRADITEGESYEDWLQRPEHIWNQGKNTEDKDE